MSESVESRNQNEQPLAVLTGASGFIGRHLCTALLDEGYRVRALLRPGTTVRLDDRVELVSVALDDAELANKLIGADVVFHLAGIAHTGVRDRDSLQRTNVEGSRAVVRACVAADVPRLIHFSSILAAKPEQSAYARSKLDGEQAVLDSASESLLVTVLRPVNVYGVGMQGNIRSLIAMIRQRRIPPLPRLQNTMVLVSVENLCQAAIAVAQTQLANAQTFVVSDSQRYTPMSIEAAIYAALGRNKPTWHSPRVLFFAAALLAELAGKLGLMRRGFGLGSYHNLVGDSAISDRELTKLKQTVAYQPSQTLEDALPAIIESLD